MIITESRLRKIIRHVLAEAGREKRMSLGTYKRDPKAGGFRKPIHQTMGKRDDWNVGDSYEDVMGFDEADEAEDPSDEAENEEEVDEASKPPGCK